MGYHNHIHDPYCKDIKKGEKRPGRIKVRTERGDTPGTETYHASVVVGVGVGKSQIRYQTFMSSDSIEMPELMPIAQRAKIVRAVVTELIEYVKIWGVKIDEEDNHPQVVKNAGACAVCGNYGDDCPGWAGDPTR